MKRSQLFTKITKQPPKGVESRNAQLLLQAGYVHQEIAGVYDYLPFGFRVLQKIMDIIREEMNAIGGQELFLTALQNPKLWEATNRWSDDVIDVWFKTEMANGTTVGLGNTHEEPITALMKNHIASYRDLPVYAYQLQTKFRNELRAKSGIMRSREFIMKDLYSFSRNQEEHELFYEKVKQAYINIFHRVGIGEKTYFTFASGGAFSQFSHEFQTICDAGEDIIYVDEEKQIAVNKEVFTDDVLRDLGLSRESLVEKKGIEVGNIFTLGTRFSDAFDLSYSDEEGKKVPVFMGCYGIGPGRLMGTIVELLSDEKGIVWPDAIAPFTVQIIPLGSNSEVEKKAEKLYDLLKEKNVEVLFDDRDLSAGVKLSEHDLLGIMHRVVISPKTIAAGDLVEYTHRVSQKTEYISESELFNFLCKK